MSDPVKRCEHDLAERETACANGMCPLCLVQEKAALQAKLVVVEWECGNWKYLHGEAVIALNNLVMRCERLEARLAEVERELAEFRIAAEGDSRQDQAALVRWQQVHDALIDVLEGRLSSNEHTLVQGFQKVLVEARRLLESLLEDPSHDFKTEVVRFNRLREKARAYLVKSTT